MRLSSRVGNAMAKPIEMSLSKISFRTPILNHHPISFLSVARTFQFSQVSWRTYATATTPPVHKGVKSFQDINVENTDSQNESEHPAMKALLEKDYEKAIELFLSDLQLPNISNYQKRQCLFNLGVSYYAQSTHYKTYQPELYESALRYLADCLEVPWDQEWESKDDYDATSAHAHSNIGTIEIQRLGPQKIIPPNIFVHFTKAAELCPQDGQIRFNLATILLREARVEEALKELEKSAELGVEIARDKIKEINERLGKINNK